MPGEVLPFLRRPNAAAAPGEVTMTGEAVCLSCEHSWQAVLEPGTASVNSRGDHPGLECPACHSLKGVLKHFVHYSESPNWHCLRCQSFVFSIILAKNDQPCVACACCGNLSNALDLFNKE